MKGKVLWFFQLPVIHDKAEKPLKREWMGSPDGEIRGSQRTMLEETKKWIQSISQGAFLLAIIVKYFRQWKWEWHHFTSLEENMNIVEVNVKAAWSQPFIHDHQTLNPCSLETCFLHKLFTENIFSNVWHVSHKKLLYVAEDVTALFSALWNL